MAFESKEQTKEHQALNFKIMAMSVTFCDFAYDFLNY